MSNIPAFGEFKCKVDEILITFGRNPAVYTRCRLPDSTKEKPNMITHVVRLIGEGSKDRAKAATAQRIGMDELRSAFPKQLGNLSDHALLSFLMQPVAAQLKETEITVSVEAQMKDGIAQIGTNKQPLYNVRLRSGLKNLDKDTADALANKLLASATSATVVTDALAKFTAKAKAANS